MIWWLILLIILLLILLLTQIRWRIRVVYEAGKIDAGLTLGPIPMRKLTETLSVVLSDSAEVAEQKRIMRENASKRRGGQVSRFQELITAAAEILQGLTSRKLRIAKLHLSVVWGCAGDPAAAAIGYGRANAAVGMIWPLIDHNFKVRKASFHIDVDYDAEEPAVSAQAVITVSTVHLVSLVFRYERKIQNEINRMGGGKQRKSGDVKHERKESSHS